MQSRRQRPLTTQQGMTLVELMVSLTLGLLITISVGYLLLSGRQSYRTSINLAGIQENGRFALEFLGKDLRMAGYIGCANLANGSRSGSCRANTGIRFLGR